MKLKIGPLLLVLLFAATAFRQPTGFTGPHADDPLLKQERRNKPLRIMVISDLNDSYGSTSYSKEVAAAIQKIPDIKPDIILCGGDMVAGQKASQIGRASCRERV